MEMFEPVVVAYGGPDVFNLAMPIRAMLELYHLYVHMYYCCQKRNVLDVLAGKIPDADYVVLVGGGWKDPREGSYLVFHDLVEEVDGEWRGLDLKLHPDDIRKTVKLQGRTVVSVGCKTGSEALAEAFLDSGCRAYIGPTEEIDEDCTTMFVCAFFHYLTVEGRDRLGEREAVERARPMDSQTASYRYYTRD